MMKFNISKITNQVINFAKKAVKPIAAKLPDKGEKLNAALKANGPTGSGAGAAKTLGAILIAHETDEVVQKVPFIKEVYNWWAGMVDSIYGKTVYKIPGFGKVAKQISDFAGKLIVPHAQEAIEKKRTADEHLNNPNWYVNTEMHTEFKIPFVYGDNLPLSFGSKIDVASVCVLTLGYNPMADQYAVESRLNQLLDLLKGIRGLSGKLPYTKGDLFFYDLVTKYVVNEYFKLKFALRLSKFYSFNKSRMPRNVMKELGWDFDDFLQNKALYVTALTNLANFITNNIPMCGTQLDKIQSMWDCFVPDSNDAKVALYYKVYPVIDAYLPSVSNNTALYERFGDKFYDFTPDKGANDYFGQGGREYNMTYSQYMSNMLSFIKKMNDNDIFTSIKGDMFGAFGSSAIWTDKDIAKYDSTDGLLGKFDELYLTTIQNATILDEQPIYRNGAPGITATAYANDLAFTLQFGGVSAAGTTEMPYTASGDPELVVTYAAQDSSGNPGVFWFAAIDGRSNGQVTSNSDTFVYTDDIGVISNKYKQSEGEDLEILQLVALDAQKGTGAQLAGSDTVTCKRNYITQCFFVTNADILYHVNGTDSKVRLGSYTLDLVGPDQRDLEFTNQAMLCAQFWSQSDYMSKLHVCVGSDLIGFKDYMLLDYNIMGSVSRSAYRQAVKYATYSVYAANLKVTESRKINNIVGIYNSR